MNSTLLPALIGILFHGALSAATFYVSPQGSDEDQQDGKSLNSAWATLAYACDRASENDTIILTSGKHVARRVAKVKNGMTIRGTTTKGKSTSQLVANTTWPLAKDPRTAESGYIIDCQNVKNVSITNLILSSPSNHAITGAISVRGSDGIQLSRLDISHFRWAALRIEHSQNVIVENSSFHNASLEKHGWHNGQIQTRWIKNSEIRHCRITSDSGYGYGYKASGHENVQIHHCMIDVKSEFAIESAHENEYGLAIHHNHLTRCISVPKGGQGANPNDRNFKYSVRIHHNLLEDSYCVEGPRNHLRIDHNYIRISKPNGRVYTHHGGKNHGPVEIDHNLVTGIDRAFVWMNEGLAENITVSYNTVTAAEAADRAGPIFGAWAAERLNDWKVKHNVFVTESGPPRKIQPERNKVPSKIHLRDNLSYRIEGMPASNSSLTHSPFLAQGKKPWPYYQLKDNSTNAGAFADGHDWLKQIPTTP
ncbi:hypothetical protein NT6N_18910 [Oceaniferula spumae]|uniref:Right handed beta helix domain-containing protein n=1 Tax=Oceaniferula spumae TaxID=2979115 RepID=A0AAT9FLH7_9BACT